MSVDWQEIRSHFAAVEGQTWLNTATYGPGPSKVEAAVREATGLWFRGRAHWPDWEREGERARERFATLLGTSATNIALLPNVSVGAGQIAENIPYRENANLVLGGSEFRSNLFPWMAQKRRGFQIRMVDFREGRLPVEDVIEAIDEHTAMVAVSSVQSLNGYRIALETLGAACQARGVPLSVDATQSIGALRFPLSCADYVIVSGYKWLLAPRGTTFLYVKSERIGQMEPIAAGWKTPADPYADYYGPPYEPPAAASRFDISLAWVSWVGAASALEYILEIGIEAIEARVLTLSRRFRTGLEELGLHSLFRDDESSQIVALEVPDPDALQRSLKQQRVVAAVRGRFLRVSFHFFNDESDVERALAALESSMEA